MRHRKAGRKFGRKSDHRKALFSNMVSSLVTHGRIETTDTKAKELRGIAEPAIHWAVQVSDLKQKEADKLAAHEKARLVHAMRMARRAGTYEPAAADSSLSLAVGLSAITTAVEFRPQMSAKER